MGLSKRTKRGIAAFNHIQTSPNRLRYMMRKLEMKPSFFSANVVQAAITAEEILNAKLSAIPYKENTPVTAAPESGEKQSLSDQSQSHASSAEAAPGEPK